MIKIKEINEDRKADINLLNEPFPLVGRMIPSYIDEQWSCRIELFNEENVSEMCFPDENYDFDAMKENHVFLGAYDGETCVGLAILRDDWMKYMYLYDLKVSRACRGQGVGRALIEGAKKICRRRDYNGLYTQGQDNNLRACEFYLKTGFHIGGLDTNVYKGTSQEGKADIIFYMDASGE